MPDRKRITEDEAMALKEGTHEDTERLNWLSDYLLRKPMWGHDSRRLVALFAAGDEPNANLREAIDAGREAGLR